MLWGGMVCGVDLGRWFKEMFGRRDWMGSSLVDG